MKRLLLAVVLLLVAGAMTYGDPVRLALVRSTVASATSDVTGSLRESVISTAAGVTKSLRKNTPARVRAVEIPRGHGGEFALKVKINDVSAPMVIDTGATSVVLTYETAKAAGLPLELLAYDVDVETAGGHTRAARLTLNSLAIGKLVEHGVPALVVPRGQMKTNLLGMSFLDRLESWEVSADKLMLRGYP
jgi:clan AA aspartic protease (TIGR02281 family)